MCGVWAKANRNNNISKEDLFFPIKMLRHRGPDSYGWYLKNQVALVHTRLSIIDLGGGAQPLQSFDKKWIGIVNGELYDYQKHRERLQSKGVLFRTHSDSEVLLNIFVKEGASALRGLSGEWTFIFYNPEQQKLIFARDPHGVKPLFYYKDQEGLTLASEIKALKNEKPVLSEDYVKTFMARSLMPQGTALDQCFHILPGRLYTYDISSGQLSHQVIDPLPLGQERSLKGIEAIEATHVALKEAVKRRLVADVEVGCYLSGGVDSALVTALAVELGAKPKAFTVGFADRDFDEKDVAAKIAAHLGIPHHVCQMNGKNFMPSLIQSIVAFENPIINPHGAAKNLLSSMASQHVKVVLSGEGADEWFGGYAYLRIQKIQKFAQKHPKLGMQVLHQFMERENGRSMNHLDGRSNVNRALFEKYFHGFQPAVLGRITKHRFYQYITGDALSDRLESMSAVLAELMEEEGLYKGPQSLKSEWDLNTWFGVRLDLLHYILANVGDRQEMSHSIEGRTPFMDPEVIRVAASIHENTLLKNLKEKYVLKQVANRLFPKEIAERPKHPFFAPLKYFHLRENREMIQQYIEQVKPSTPWLAWDRIERLLNTSMTVDFPLFELQNSTKIMLFSLGVLVGHLRQDPSPGSRGFQVPEKVEDLLPFEFNPI